MSIPKQRYQPLRMGEQRINDNRFRYLFAPQSPAFGCFEVTIARLAERGELSITVAEMREALKQMSPWRWLRRLHLERQLAVLELALYSFMCGRYQ